MDTQKSRKLSAPKRQTPRALVTNTSTCRLAAGGGVQEHDRVQRWDIPVLGAIVACRGVLLPFHAMMSCCCFVRSLLMIFANLMEISSLSVEFKCIQCRVECSFTFVPSTSTKLNKSSVLLCLLLNTFASLLTPRWWCQSHVYVEHLLERCTPYVRLFSRKC